MPAESMLVGLLENYLRMLSAGSLIVFSESVCSR